MPAKQGRRFQIGQVPPLAEGFTDRPDTAHGIMDILVPGSAAALVSSATCAQGMPNWLGACGKTQIAVLIAESLWRSQAIDMLIWISVTNRASILSGFVEASMAATGIERTGTAESVAVRFVSWLGETGQPWLVVFDDLPETTDLDGLMPTGPTGRLLVTCARPAVAIGGPGTRVISVGLFSVREALNGLTERLSTNPFQRQGAIDLVEALDREPLALAQAAAVVASSNLTCRDYRDFLVSRREQRWSGSDEMSSAAMVTWILSLERAEALLPGETVRLMLVLVALLDGHGIPGVIFATRAVAEYLGAPATSTATDSKWAWDALLAIERTGLISVNRDVTPPTVGMNSAVQMAIRLAAPAQVQEPAARTAASALLELWPAEEPQPWAAASLRANAASLQDSAADVLWADGCHPLLLRAGRSLDEARMVSSAVEYWQDLAARCDTKLPPGHPDAIVVAEQLAAAYLEAGQARDAVQWYQRVLGERTRELPPGHPDAIVVAEQLAAAYLEAGQARDAVQWYQRVLGERTRELAPGHSAVVATRVSLARALIMAGEPKDAVTVLLRAVAECEQFRGGTHRDTLSVRDELAAAYQTAGDVTAATRLLARSLTDRERLQGPRNPQTMATRDRLAAACLNEGKIKDAINHYKRALGDREKVLGRSHPDTIATAASLSAAYRTAGRMPAATQLAEQCCADSERVLGPDHADTLVRLVNLAYLYYAVGRVGDAEALLRETLVRCERTLPAGDALTRTVRQSLANIGEG